ncbi:MAG: hypothetical protein V4506_08590 [Bacteroidota bacterium]
MAEELSLLLQSEWVEKFKLQTYKDYELAGVLQHLPFLETTTLAELEQAFYQSVVKLEMSHALKNLLYRIDLTELQIKQAALKNPEKPLQWVLAELMIKRILQKVVLKDMYSK